MLVKFVMLIMIMMMMMTMMMMMMMERERERERQRAGAPRLPNQQFLLSNPPYAVVSVEILGRTSPASPDSSTPPVRPHLAPRLVQQQPAPCDRGAVMGICRIQRHCLQNLRFPICLDGITKKRRQSKGIRCIQGLPPEYSDDLEYSEYSEYLEYSEELECSEYLEYLEDLERSAYSG